MKASFIPDWILTQQHCNSRAPNHASFAHIHTPFADIWSFWTFDWLNSAAPPLFLVTSAVRCKSSCENTAVLLFYLLLSDLAVCLFPLREHVWSRPFRYQCDHSDQISVRGREESESHRGADHPPERPVYSCESHLQCSEESRHRSPVSCMNCFTFPVEKSSLGWTDHPADQYCVRFLITLLLCYFLQI